ncbi:MAG: HAD-IIB family hydrolase, partial [Lachnospiraceae bacterium]|nr:HAD-IIB family hydrolase [Lachnospiraceae bacterium]
IPDSAKEALTKAQANGHLTFINTGRPLSILPKEVMELPFDGYLCGCGSHIIVNDTVIFDQELTSGQCSDILFRARKMSVPVILEGNQYCYIDSKGAIDPKLDANNHLLMEEFPDSILDAAKCEQLSYSKFCAICQTREQLDEFLSPFCDFLEPIDRGSHFYEIVPAGFSKASAIDTVLRYLDQPIDDCYAFGDSSNDLSMLNHVPYSIAMGNSDDVVLKAASYVTTPVWRHGIYTAMKHFQLI